MSDAIILPANGVQALYDEVNRLAAERDQLRAELEQTKRDLAEARDHIARHFPARGSQIGDLTIAEERLTEIVDGVEKIKLNLDDQHTREIWETVLRAKREVESWPDWKRYGTATIDRRAIAIEAERDQLRADLALANEKLTLTTHALHQRYQFAVDATVVGIAAMFDGLAVYYEQNRTLGPFCNDMARNIRNRAWLPGAVEGK